MIKIFILLILITYSSTNYAIYAHSTQSNGETITQYQCIANSIDYIILFAYNAYANEGVVSHCIDQIALAQTAGIKNIDIIVNAFPNFTPTKQPSDIANEVFTAFKGKFRMVWLRTGNLNSGIPTNRGYMMAVYTAFRKLKIPVGIYSSLNDWESAFGEWMAFSESTLIYSGDSQPNFNDFVEFGLWSKPTMKLFDDSADYCKLDASLLYY